MAGLPNSVKSDFPPVILLGLGFTTGRLARRLLLRGGPVFAEVRDAGRFRGLASVGLRLEGAPTGAVLVHTIPPLPAEETARVRSRIVELQPRRVLYISSTGVYGRQSEVTEKTPADPWGLKGEARIAEENWIEAGDWESLVLRPAAIYGPGRGVHVRMNRGEVPRGSGSGIVSRIHVDDLAAVLEAGIGSDVGGRWPLADDHPCSSDEINSFCGRLMRVPVPEGQKRDSVEGRRVDGTAIREILGVRLSYPDYEAGILASLAEAGR